MDTMTLLCNLQAEGPATLRKLREIDCGTFESLRVTPIGRLAEALGVDETRALRFRREAELLEQRCGSEFLEAEELGPSTSSDSVPSTATRQNMPTASSEAFPPGEERLEPEVLKGLDAELCCGLQAQGVVTFRQLWEASALELARRTGRPLTRLVDMQCEARIHLDGRREDPVVSTYTIIPATSPSTGISPRAALAYQSAGTRTTFARIATGNDPGIGGPFA